MHHRKHSGACVAYLHRLVYVATSRGSVEVISETKKLSSQLSSKTASKLRNGIRYVQEERLLVCAREGDRVISLKIFPCILDLVHHRLFAEWDACGAISDVTLHVFSIRCLSQLPIAAPRSRLAPLAAALLLCRPPRDAVRWGTLD